MKPREIVQDAAFRALEGEVLPGERIPQAMFRIISDEMHLENFSLDLENFSLDNAKELRDNLKHTSGDEAERAVGVAKSLKGLRGQAYGLYETFSDGSISEIEQEGEALTASIINGVVSYAEAYPNTPDKDMNDKFVEAFKTAFKPSDDSNAKLRSAHVATEIITPYFSERIVAVDWSSNKSALSGIKKIAADFKIFGSLYHSIAPVVEHGFDADESLHKELAEKLFSIGPLFAKTGQALAGVSGAASSEAQSKFLANVGRALQEGIAQPTHSDLAQMRKELPQGIECDDVISSASIAHILRVHNTQGMEMAVKVKRDNIDGAITDNVRAYQLLVDIAEAFVRSHAGDSAFTTNLDVITKALPFALRMLEDDIRKELDTVAEADAQILAIDKFQQLPEIVIPKVYKDISDNRHLFMDIEPAERIDELPANPQTLKNLMVFGLQMWKKKMWHADLHPGNIKARTDGTIVVYDWAKPIELSPKFMRDIVSFVRAVSTGKPKKVAKAYQRIQSDDYEQVDNEAVALIAHDVFESTPNGSIRKNKSIQRFVMAMGIRHQSTLDFKYASFMRSTTAFATVVKTELSKPEYGGKFGQASAVTRATISAFGRVYLSRKKRQTTTVAND